MAEIVCLGILVVDVIGRPIESVPPRGALALVDSITPHIGGCAANTGIGLQKLGVATRVIGKVGRDGFGDFVQTELEKYGVEAAISRDSSAPTSATMVLVAPDAERSFLHCVGANATFDSPDFDLDLLDGARMLHIAGHGLMPRLDGASCVRLLQAAREKGLQTSLDTAGAPNADWVEKLRLCLPYLDFFVPSLHEAHHLLPGEQKPELVAEYLLEQGVKTVALKMGERGCLVTNGHETHELPPFQVAAVDATGAGDAFAAGFLCGLMRGFDLRGCAQLGNAVGALCVTQVGTVAGVRSLEATQRFISTGSTS